MTSKRLFFRAMKEDLRHKMWMIALSCLGSFLAHPVIWLMAREGLKGQIAMLEDRGFSVSEQADVLLNLYGRNTIMPAAAVAVAGAVIVGLFGFRFLFHSSSVDTYHSLPVKRRTLFALCYLDGFLIWLVPAALCLGAASVIAGSLLKGSGEALWPELFRETFVCLLLASLAFLMVYNLVLTAVMLSGNILNTLVSMLMLGFGAVAAWGLFTGFLQIYMETFRYRQTGLEPVLYASPLLSAPTAVNMFFDYVGRGESVLEHPDMLRVLGINLAVTAALGICAWLLYRRRDSEQAGQGIRSRAVSAVMRTAGGMGSGMCGWMFFSQLSETSSSVWGIFGAVLAGTLAFGVLDIVFHMEFGAFFAHKGQMAVTLAALLLLCMSFDGDWFGFDTRLPEKEEIESVGIFHEDYANRPFYSSFDSEAYPLERVRLQDMEKVYPFLERVAARQEEPDFLKSVPCLQFAVKVTLKNGRSYYRNYSLPEEDMETVLPLLTDEAYLRQIYLLDTDLWKGKEARLILARGDSRLDTTKTDPEVLRSVAQAYNQDLLEDPEGVITGKGRLLAWLQIPPLDQAVLDIYDSMERTVEALRQAGFGEWVETPEVSETASLRLGLERGYGAGAGTAEELVLAARLTYGVPGEETRESLEEKYRAMEEERGEIIYYDSEYDEEIYDDYYGIEYSDGVHKDAVSGRVYPGEEGSAGVYITDPEEIAELLPLVSYTLPGRGTGLFQKEFIRISLTDADGKKYPAYLREGQLPEKYIYRFENLEY